MINGVNPKVVQERLGHSRVAITLDLYSHVHEDLLVEATMRLENVDSGSPYCSNGLVY